MTDKTIKQMAAKILCGSYGKTDLLTEELAEFLDNVQADCRKLNGRIKSRQITALAINTFKAIYPIDLVLKDEPKKKAVKRCKNEHDFDSDGKCRGGCGLSQTAVDWFTKERQVYFGGKLITLPADLSWFKCEKFKW